MPTHRICAASMVFGTVVICSIHPDATYVIYMAGGLCALLVHWALAKQMNERQ